MILNQLVRNRKVRKGGYTGKMSFRQVDIKMTMGIKMKCLKGSSGSKQKSGEAAFLGENFQTLQNIDRIVPQTLIYPLLRFASS